MVDHFCRECLLLEAGASMTGKSVAKALERLSLQHPLPKMITVDIGSEFFSKDMDPWAYRRDVNLEFIPPGMPIEKTFIESFNGRQRDECLNARLVFSTEDARRKIEMWRVDCNTVRPPSSLGGRSPRELPKAHQQEVSKASILNF